MAGAPSYDEISTLVYRRYFYLRPGASGDGPLITEVTASSFFRIAFIALGLFISGISITAV